MGNDVELEINKIKNLKQNKNKSTSAIAKLAQHNVWKKQIDIKSSFEDKEDQKIAEEIFDSYLENYQITSFNDVQNVADLVFEETLKQITKKQINKITSDKNANFSPDKLIDTLHKIEERIWEIKNKLGINDAEKEKDDLTALEELKEKLKIYIPFNRNEFTTVCPDCGNPQLLRRRCGSDNWENLKHPFFSGRFWYNRRGIELVKAGIWTKEQYAWVFFTSVSYVDWCLEKENEIVKIDDVEEKEIQKFISENDFLKEVIIPKNIKKGK